MSVDLSANLSGLLGALSNTDAGGCPAPYISESLWPHRGGYLGGRNCAENPLTQIPNAPRCCIPCPVFNWVYDDSFDRLSNGAGWVHFVGAVLCAFLLLSMAVLPTKYTRRAYLNIMLLVGVCILSVGFIIPLFSRTDQCFDPVTPHDMTSSLSCAWGGGMATFGGMFLVTWMLARALFMHLQICWNFAPGKVSYIAASVSSFVVTIVLTAATLAKSGVSYRYGNFCQINVGSIPTYWGWLLAFAGLAFFLQLATFAYCIKVYLTANLSKQQPLSSEGSTFDSPSSRRKNARTALTRVQQVLLLQWRSLAIVVLAIFVFAWVCVVFIVLDSQLTESAFNDTEALIPWLLCLITTKDNNACTQYTSVLIVDQKIAVATLYILGFIGIEAFFLLCRFEVFAGWWQLLKKTLGRKKRRPRPITDDDFVIMHQPAANDAHTREEEVEKTLHHENKF